MKLSEKILSNAEIVDLASSAGAITPVSNVSERYSFVSTLTAVDLLRDAGWYPIAANQQNVRKEDRQGYQKHMIRFSRDVQAKETERLDILLYNSHDKVCSFKLIAGIWRFACSNGLVVGSEHASFTHKHVGFSPDKFIVSAGKIANSAGLIADTIDEFQTIEMTPDESGAYAMAAHQYLYGDTEKAPVTPDQLLTVRRNEDQPANLWNVFNVLQENIVKGGLSGKVRGQNGRLRRTTTRPVKSIDKDLKLNQALWTLTEKMAEIKKRQ